MACGRVFIYGLPRWTPTVDILEISTQASFAERRIQLTYCRTPVPKSKYGPGVQFSDISDRPGSPTISFFEAFGCVWTAASFSWRSQAFGPRPVTNCGQSCLACKAAESWSAQHIIIQASVVTTIRVLEIHRAMNDKLNKEKYYA